MWIACKEGERRGQMAMTNSEPLPERPLLSSRLSSPLPTEQQGNKGMNCEAANKNSRTEDDVISLCRSQNKHNGRVPPPLRSQAPDQKRKRVFSTANCSLRPHHTGRGKSRFYSWKYVKQSLFLYYYIIFRKNNCKPTFAPPAPFHGCILEQRLYC